MRFSVTSIILGAAAIAGQSGQVSASPTENWGIMCTDVNLGGTCSGFKSPSNDCTFMVSTIGLQSRQTSDQHWMNRPIREKSYAVDTTQDDYIQAN
ncbi:hypothetical protein CFAM422_012389 [Trichoderma lentiforme]|uniref:Uncharacterized protein n=1 Tax=Trichoderma lentiforme TaxID=1567552 RepID=A0A9P5C7R9_9HYPO|nr:hypothetical protein CFAM422_012389 [Trichoderma lentiforme]